MNTQTVALQAQQMSVRRGGASVLQDLDLHAMAGQWLAIIGPNGAGKSTVLRCLAGLMQPAQGQVLWSGRAASAWPARARAQHLAWLGQDALGGDAMEAMSVQDTVALGRLPHQGALGWMRLTAVDQQAIAQALADTDLTWAAQRSLASLSGGERQRVARARALAVQAPVLLLDEPVAHLDAPHQRLLAQVLRREAGAGRCIVSVLHELPLALQADRIAVMAQGQVLACGAHDDANVHCAIEAVFDQAVAIVSLQGRWVAVPTL